LGKAEITAEACVERYQVVPDNRPMLPGDADHLFEFAFSPKRWVEVERDAVEPAVDRRSERSSRDSARAFHRVEMLTLNPDVRQVVPILGGAKRAEDGLIRGRDCGGGIVEEPNRGCVHKLFRFWIIVGMPPLYPLAGYCCCLLVSLEEHRVLLQEVDVIGAILRKADLTDCKDRAEDRDQRESAEARETTKAMGESSMFHG